MTHHQRIHLFSLLALAISLGFGSPVAKADQPVNVSLVPDVAIFSKTTHIKGFILNIWGQNPQTALAIGLVNGSTGDSKGVSFAALANYTENYTGAHLGFLNYASGAFKGLQWGAVNYAQTVNGVQLGVINYAAQMNKGIQIGLVNVIAENKHFFSELPEALAPFFVVFNWRL